MATTFIYSKYNETGQNNAISGTLTYVYRWKITNWSGVKPFVEHTSQSFSADGLQWVFKFYKGRQKNPQAISLYLGILEVTPGCLRGIRKKVSIMFVLENLRTRGMDFGKVELPVWFCEKHSTWGEENLISLDEMDRFISNDTISLLVKFDVQESIIDSPPSITNPFHKLVNSSRFSDVKFRVADEWGREKIFYAHKGILASASPVFEAMLTNGMKETFDEEIILRETNHGAFLALLTFIYTFKFNLGSMVETEKLLALANRLNIIPVREECLRHLRLELNLDNVWGIWELAEKYICPKTNAACRDFVALHLGELLEKPSTLHADPSILRLALENDEANIDSEELIFEFVVRWASHSRSSRRNTQTQTTLVSQTTSEQECDSSAAATKTAKDDLPLSMPSELSKKPDDKHNNAKANIVTAEEIHDENTSDSDEEYSDVDDTNVFPRPWRGDRLAALPSLLECVRFPMMQKRYLCDKVETQEMVMSAEGIKDLLLEAYRYHLMPDVATRYQTSRINRRRKVNAQCK